MKIIPFFARGWEANSYLVISEGQAALIDAGAPTKSILEALDSENAKLEYILLTHGHFDHTVTADALRKATGAKLIIHTDDEEMLTDPEKSVLASFLGRYDTVAPSEKAITDGERIPLGKEEIIVIHTPGHSKGSVCYLTADSLFTGDTLFDGGFGRYDLHGGDFMALRASLSRLKELDGKLDIFPGHGNSAKLENALNLLKFI